MSATAARLLVSEDQVLSTAYATIAVASVFTFARFAVRLTQPKKELEIEDAICLFSWIAFLVLSILYIVVTPTLYRVDTAVSTGNFYPTMLKDSLFIIEIFFANTMIFWVVLWSVKLSLLFLFRRLFIGLPDQMKWWWSVLIFTGLVSLWCPLGWPSIADKLTSAKRCLSDASSQILPPVTACTLGLLLVSIVATPFDETLPRRALNLTLYRRMFYPSRCCRPGCESLFRFRRRRDH